MSVDTNPVMMRYRELAQGLSGLEASRVVLWEECGPVWTYARGDASKMPPMSERGLPIDLNVPANLSPSGDVPTQMSPPCEGCGDKPREAGRSLCSACRKQAYRGRRD